MAICYSQRDVEWAEDHLGTSADLTLGQAGCLVSAMASVLSDFTDQVIAPGELNQWLKQNNGFAKEALFIWDSVAALGLRRSESISCMTQPAPIKHLAEVLADGAAVVVQVDSVPDGPVNQHWVRLLSVDDKDGQIVDPWQLPGKELIALSRYFAQGWTPTRAIFMAVVYNAAAPTREVVGDGGHQPVICPRPEDPADAGRSLASAGEQAQTERRRRVRRKASA